MPWNLDSERSVYLQLMEIIKKKILAGEYKAGDRLDSVRELALSAGVNPNTMQRALTELEREGLLYSIRTSGRFITEDKQLIEKTMMNMARDDTLRYLEHMKQLGLTKEQIIDLINNTNQ